MSKNLVVLIICVGVLGIISGCSATKTKAIEVLIEDKQDAVVEQVPAPICTLAPEDRPSRLIGYRGVIWTFDGEVVELFVSGTVVKITLRDEAKGCLEINDIGQEVTISAVPTQLTGSNAIAIGYEVSK